MIDTIPGDSTLLLPSHETNALHAIRAQQTCHHHSSRSSFECATQSDNIHELAVGSLVAYENEDMVVAGRTSERTFLTRIKSRAPHSDERVQFIFVDQRRLALYEPISLKVKGKARTFYTRRTGPGKEFTVFAAANSPAGDGQKVFCMDPDIVVVANPSHSDTKAGQTNASAGTAAGGSGRSSRSGDSQDWSPLKTWRSRFKDWWPL